MQLHTCVRLVAAAFIVSASPAAVQAQVLYNNGATLTITGGGSLTVKGNLTNTASSSITNSGTLSVTGNTVNDGTVTTTGTSTLKFQGAGMQTLGGSSPVNATDVLMDNAAGVTLNTPLIVDGTLTLANGIIVAASASSPLTIAASGSVAGASDASHVDGYVKKFGAGGFTFPTGDATRYQPVGVNLSANTAGMVARYMAADPGAGTFGTGGSSPTPLLYVNRSEYWELQPSGTATGTVTIYFDNYRNTGIASTSDLRVAHKVAGVWLNEGGTPAGSPTSGSVTSASISTFSPFTLGSVSANSPLPVGLVRFGGATKPPGIVLEWQTAIEDPGTLFFPERSNQAGTFEQLGRVSGKGADSRYTFDDPTPLPGTGYYRLRIRESDGTESFSRVVALAARTQGHSPVSVFPMPASQSVQIQCGAELEGSVATLVDALGQVLQQFRLETGYTLDLRPRPAGTYTLRLSDGSAVRIVKQ